MNLGLEEAVYGEVLYFVEPEEEGSPARMSVQLPWRRYKNKNERKPSQSKPPEPCRCHQSPGYGAGLLLAIVHSFLRVIPKYNTSP